MIIPNITQRKKNHLGRPDQHMIFFFIQISFYPWSSRTTCHISNVIVPINSKIPWFRNHYAHGRPEQHAITSQTWSSRSTHKFSASETILHMVVPNNMQFHFIRGRPDQHTKPFRFEAESTLCMVVPNIMLNFISLSSRSTRDFFYIQNTLYAWSSRTICHTFSSVVVPINTQIFPTSKHIENAMRDRPEQHAIS